MSENKNPKIEREGKVSEQKATDRIVRILSTDLEGNMTLYAGLAKIKGVSWAMSNATCKILKMDKRKKIGDLTEKEIEIVSEFLKNPQVPKYLTNRRKDLDSGKDKHIIGGDLDLRKEFDIKRLKKIKSYRGIRHGAGLPTKGQRTRSNFRKNRAKGAGIKKKNKKVEGTK